MLVWFSIHCLHEATHQTVLAWVWSWTCVCVCVLVHVCLCVLVHDVLVYFYPLQWLESRCNTCSGHGITHNQRANMWATWSLPWKMKPSCFASWNHESENKMALHTYCVSIEKALEILQIDHCQSLKGRHANWSLGNWHMPGSIQAGVMSASIASEADGSEQPFE